MLHIMSGYMYTYKMNTSIFYTAWALLNSSADGEHFSMIT